METEDISELEEKDYTPPKAPEPIIGFLEEYRKSLGDGSRKYEGLETGMKQIDDLIGGLSRFVLMAGMGGVGKSTLALQLALGVVEKEQIPVLYYSFEMGRRDVVTMALQNLSRTLMRGDIELRGNSPDLAEDKKEMLEKSLKEFERYAGKLYIIDTIGGTPTMEDIENQVRTLKMLHNSKDILVVFDSVQDLVPIESNQVQAEAKTCQRIVELQQATNATILAIAQKNKSGVREGGGYASVMGSVAFIHKPTTVVELVGGKEAIAKALDTKAITPAEAEQLEKSLNSDTKTASKAYPVYMNVIKGRNTGYGGVALKYHGAHRYYEVGQEKDFESLYKAVREVGLI